MPVQQTLQNSCLHHGGKTDSSHVLHQELATSHILLLTAHVEEGTVVVVESGHSEADEDHRRAQQSCGNNAETPSK